MGVNLALFCAWPSLQGVRLLFVIFPMLAILIVVGLMEFWQLAKPFFDAQVIFLVLKKSSNWAIVFSGLVLIQGLATSVHYIATDSNQAFSNEITEVYSFVESTVKPNERISFHKPRLMRYVTGAEVFKIATDIPINATDEPLEMKPFDLESAKKELVSKRINYWILPISRGMLMGGKVEFPVAFKNSEFVVYKVQ